MEKQLTHEAYGHVLTNVGCWSADGQWLVYDTRSDVAGSQFDGRWIERVHVESGRIERLYESGHGACCGVVTCCPVTDRIVFIHGPENPTLEWQYAAYHRRGMILVPGEREPVGLDAMCYAPPLVAGALRGGSHVHTFDGAGQRVAFTYEDHLLATHSAHQSKPADKASRDEPDHSGSRAAGDKRSPVNASVERNQRNVAVSVPGRAIRVPRTHPRNHDGTHFSVVVTRTWDRPIAGSDQIDRAYEDAWVGTHGYARVGQRLVDPNVPAVDLGRQVALAFLGDLITSSGQRLTELYLVDVPDDMYQPSDDGPLEGTSTTRPLPPRGTRQRRLTHTTEYPYPGVYGARHWPRSTPDGSQIFFLMRDSKGTVQIWGISPTGGDPKKITNISEGIDSSFSVSPSGELIAYISNDRIWVTEVGSGLSRPITRSNSTLAKTLRPEACVFAPDGRFVAYVRTTQEDGQPRNQIFVASVD